MSRIVIDTLSAAFERGYRGDHFHSLRSNLTGVTEREWDARLAQHSVEVPGNRPDPSIADLVRHVGGAIVMYTDRAFGPAAIEWQDVPQPELDVAGMLAWLDEVHGAFAAGLATLADDAQLAEERPGPSRERRMSVEQLVWLMINHDLYHAGEINRQRELVVGTERLSSAD